MPPSNVVVGESAGGNFAAAVTLRLRDEVSLAGQVLIYPSLGHGFKDFPSSEFFELTMAEGEGPCVFRTVLDIAADASSGVKVRDGGRL
ncbi:hypothetical protein GCM10010191_60370 [Actinomadura vinacea]|uniref:Alpha/beta hydrolase fold-3 domain-containing protein n=1 Tax=Actinomadura vinacea TaxID=115336 RepID=A0ABP5WYI7_9ACTN